MTLLRLITAGTSLLLALGLILVSNQSRAEIPGSLSVRPGDVLKIGLEGQGATVLQLKVRPDGRISLPLINELQVSGLSPSEIRERVGARIGALTIDFALSDVPESEKPGTIQAGAMLLLGIQGEATPARQVLVRPDGLLALPLVGEIQAAGLTLEALRQQVSSRAQGVTIEHLTGPIESSEDKFKLGSGDVLEISVWGDQTLSKQVIVRPDGYISFPLIGECPASGLTVAELRQEVESKIRLFLPSAPVSVTLVQLQSATFFVIGRVNKPGMFIMPGPTTVVQALAMAGGMDPWADRNDIVIVRTENGKQTIIPFKYSKVLSGKNLSMNITLKPGDTVMVP